MEGQNASLSLYIYIGVVITFYMLPITCPVTGYFKQEVGLRNMKTCHGLLSKINSQETVSESPAAQDSGTLGLGQEVEKSFLLVTLGWALGTLPLSSMVSRPLCIAPARLQALLFPGLSYAQAPR